LYWKSATVMSATGIDVQGEPAEITTQTRQGVILPAEVPVADAAVRAEDAEEAQTVESEGDLAQTRAQGARIGGGRARHHQLLTHQPEQEGGRQGGDERQSDGFEGEVDAVGAHAPQGFGPRANGPAHAPDSSRAA
jgi:hypothetical protein